MKDATAAPPIEARLLEAEARYRNLVEQLPAATYICMEDEVATHLYVSPQIEELMGYTPEEWLADPELWIKRIHSEDRKRVLAEVARTAGKLPFHSEYRAIRKDGREIWLRDQDRPVRDEAGRILYSQGIYLDITEEKEAEQALRESERRKAAILDAALDAVVSMDHEGRITEFNPAAERTFGYSRGEVLGRTVAETIIPASLRDRHLRGLARYLATGVAAVLGQRVEMRALRADGSEFPVELTLTRVDVRKEPRFTAFIRDITERRLQERALRESENRYRALAESTGHIVWTKGSRGDLEEAADDWYQMTGQSPQEAAGDGWLRVIHPDDRDRAVRLWRESEKKRSVYENEYRVRKRDGTYEWWAAHATPILEDDGTIGEWVGWSRNITEKKLAEEALEQALEQEREAADRLRTLDEMKNTFLAAVSHELRTPLAAVLGAALTLEREDMALSPEVTGELVHGVAVNARRLDRLLSELLDVDRLSRGILTPQLRPTDVGALVRRAIEQTEAFGERPILVEVEPVIAQVDPAKVERIVENLVANAVRHTSPGGSIWVRVRREDGGALIAVEDDGPGVPDGYRETIFEAFQRGPNTPSHVPGTGIGLSLVSGFAELHGGRAWVQERDGGGASFRVFLPGEPAPVLSPRS